MKMTDFADDSSLSMSANFGNEGDDSKANGENGKCFAEFTHLTATWKTRFPLIFNSWQYKRQL